MSEEFFGKGAIESSKDNRDYQWEKIGKASAPFDWEKGFETLHPVKVKDQNGSYSCGGQAVAYYGEILNGVADGVQEERSAKFIYAPIAYPNGGSVGRDLMERVTKYGWGREALTPSYENGHPPAEDFMIREADITQEALDEARDEKALSYVRIVDTTNIDTIAQAIRDNNGALIGLDGQNGKGWVTAYPQVAEKIEWRHWVYGCGAKLINGKKYIKIINSWGKDVGDMGYQYISEDHFTKGHCFEAWTCVYNTKPEIGFRHTFNYDMQRGMTGDEIKALQAVLRLEGLFKYPIDTGNYGEITQRAVYDFQCKYNIAPFTRWIYKGFYCGPATRKVLNEKYGKM